MDPLLNIDNPFTLNELEKAIDVSKDKSTPGLDQIDNVMLKNSPTTLRIKLLQVINEIFISKTFPNSWKNFLILLIPKNCKNKFRPIALASCILKISERIINARLQHYIEKNKLIPDSQNGFRRSKSCSLALAQLITNIHSAFNKNDKILCILLDIKAAFDHVCPLMLQKTLINLNIPPNTRHFIYNLMTNRQLSFKVANEIHGPWTKHIGVPQGCVLSPILYNIYINSLNNHLNQQLDLIQYADDTLITCQTNSIQTGINTLENSLTDIKNYFNSLSLSISPEKTKFIIFSKDDYSNIKDFTLNFDNTSIHPSNNIKYLGMTLDHSLTWIPHYNNIIGKALKLLNLLKFLRNTWWGGHQSVLLNIYTALIRSTIEYNLFLTYCQKPALRDKLQKTQNQAIRLALGYRNSTPINVMHAESNLPSIFSRVRRQSDIFILKTLTFQNPPLINKINNLIEDLSIKDKFNIQSHFLPISSLFYINNITNNLLFKHALPLPFNYSYAALSFNPTIDTYSGFLIKVDAHPPTKFLDIFNQDFTNKTAIFTDASKIDNNNTIGFALYIPNPEE